MENVGRYVARYEEVRQHNALHNQSDWRLVEVNTYCSPSRVENEENGFVVSVRCGWNAVDVDVSGNVTVVDGAGYTTTYFVNETMTDRRSAYWGTSTPAGAITTFADRSGDEGRLPLDFFGLLLLFGTLVATRSYSSGTR